MKKQRVFLGVIIILLCSILLQWVQIQNQNLYLGYDWIFHYNRFYDAAQQIKEGNFQYFISMYGFSQSGRIINALYGPIFAYVNGLLLLICGSWFKYQLLSNFLITFLSAMSLFTMLIKNKVRVNISVIFSVFYSCLYVVQSWSFNQAFGSWGAIILPLIVLAGTQFLKENYSKKNAAFLAFAMTLAIQIHVLTSLFAVMVLMIFFIAGLIYSSDKMNLLLKVVLAAGATVLMTANVWYPLFEVNHENQLMRPAVVMNMEQHALSLDIIRPFHDLSLVVLLLFVIQFLLAIYGKTSKINKLVIVAAFIFFGLSSKVFPWNSVAAKFPAITMIQFPARFLLPAIVLIILSLALSFERLLKENTKSKYILVYLALIVLSLGAVNDHLTSAVTNAQVWKTDKLFSSRKNNIFETKDNKKLKASFQKNNLAEPLELVSKRNSDYLPVADKELAYDDDFHPYGKQKRAILTNPINDKLTKKVVNHKLQVSWNSDGRETLLPLIIYQRTQVEVNGKLLPSRQIKKNEIGALKVQPKVGKNSVSISYKNSYLFYVTMIIAVLSWIAFAIIALFII